jgi:hypothetical protein
MPDFMGSILVFSVVLTIFLFSWNSVESNQHKFSEEEQIRQNAYYTTTFLVSTPGYPENWTAETVEIPGFASEDNVISRERVREFKILDYEEQKKFLSVEEFSLNITYDEGDKKITIGKFNPNASFVAPVRRQIVVKEPKANSDLLWPRKSIADEENVNYLMNFTIEPDSNTIGNSLNSIDINIDSSSDIFSNTSADDIIYVGVDKDGDGTLEKYIEDDINDWTIQNGGSDLKIGFEGSYENTEEGDTIIFELADITNPSTGNHDVSIQTSGDGNWQNDIIEIGKSRNFHYQTRNAELELVVWR